MASPKDLSRNHYLVLDGYRIAGCLRTQGWDAKRTVLGANYIGNDTLEDCLGAFDYKIPLAGDVTPAILDALNDFASRDATVAASNSVLLTDAGLAPGNAAIIGNGRVNGIPADRNFDAIATWDVIWGSTDNEHVIQNSVGTLANHIAPTSSALTASGDGVAVEMAAEVFANEEIGFAVHEPDSPGPTSGSTLVGVLESAIDSIFTTPIVRITLAALGDTRGSEFDTLAGPLPAGLFWRVAWTITGGSPERYPIAAFGKRLITS